MRVIEQTAATTAVLLSGTGDMEQVRDGALAIVTAHLLRAGLGVIDFDVHLPERAAQQFAMFRRYAVAMDKCIVGLHSTLRSSIGGIRAGGLRAGARSTMGSAVYVGLGAGDCVEYLHGGGGVLALCLIATTQSADFTVVESANTRARQGYVLVHDPRACHVLGFMNVKRLPPEAPLDSKPWRAKQDAMRQQWLDTLPQ